MDKKGQALVVFILLIPIILAIFAFVVDYGITFYKKNEVASIVASSLKNNHDVKEELTINKINYKKIEIKEENNEKCVIINFSVDSLFGNIIGKKEYSVRIRKCRG